jgi:hypothetical protein
MFKRLNNRAFRSTALQMMSEYRLFGIFTPLPLARIPLSRMTTVINKLAATQNTVLGYVATVML